jgi:CO/xanthine dehydrogenase Mo-binding subunit/aerobic-type carbon monoxide dehydrogenase small subunit (CoxS/CutS family)
VSTNKEMVGMKKQIITLKVNGQPYDVTVTPRDTLSSTLRNQLGLFGVKEGCGEGQCGSCTVMRDGKAITSCLMPAIDAEGHELTTIEGLAAGGQMTPVQEAFVHRGGAQCGFCSPGQVMAATALLKENKSPTEEQIRAAMNLCRCTGYQAIVDSIQAAAEHVRTGKPANGKGSETRVTVTGRETLELKAGDLVGQPIPRIDAKAKVVGTAAFGADYTMPGMVWARILRSPHAHAKILSIDTSKAEKLPGVLSVATAKDTPGHRFGIILADETIFATGKVRYKNQPVAAVAAVDLATAEAALALIEVKYEPLPAVFDMEEALKPGAPLVHPESNEYTPGAIPVPVKPQGNMISCRAETTGDCDKAFQEADVVVEERYHTATSHQGYLEPHACVASFDATGKLTVWTTTQGHFYTRAGVSMLLGMPFNNVRVIAAEIGGGFGGKVAPFCETIAAVLARKAGRPVKIVLTRQEELEDTRNRSATVTYIKTGAKKDGTLVARQVKYICDAGAFCDWTPATALLLSPTSPARGPYKIPNHKLEGIAVYTNKSITGAVRAPGFPQLTLALESNLDEVAKKLGMDPYELRMKNALGAGDTTFVGNKLKTAVFTDMLKKVKAVVDADPAKNEPNTAWGYGCGEWATGGAAAGATVKVNEDGSIGLVIGTVDQTGTRTALAQVVADVLAVGVEQVVVNVGDTDSALAGPLSAGSRITYNMAHTVRIAARQLATALLAQGAKLLNAKPEQCELQGGKIAVKGDASKSIPFGGLGETQLQGTAAVDAIPPAHSFAVQAVKVRVDPETGQVRVLRAVAAQDCGTAINPQCVEMQVAGAMAQGMGYALYEHIDHEQGAVVNQGFAQYTMPTASDIPPFEIHLFEGELGAGEGHGAKGMGEPPHVPTCAAVSNAIRNATGVRVRQMPMTPEVVWRALRETHR